MLGNAPAPDPADNCVHVPGVAAAVPGSAIADAATTAVTTSENLARRPHEATPAPAFRRTDITMASTLR